MSQRVLCTFSGSRYHDTTKLIVERAEKMGCTKPAMVFDDVWLKTQKEHCAATKWAFDHPKVRGVNWFCWKPYVLIAALDLCQDGDVVCFTDADCWPVADMTPLFDMCERDNAVLFSACSHSQRNWCKRDAMIICNIDSDKWRDRQAGVARFMLFKKGSQIKSVKNEINMTGEDIPVDDFLLRWYFLTCDQRGNTFDPSVIAPEYPDLKEGRAEQAILTNLAHGYSILLHREADQWGNGFEKDFPNDTYGQIFESTGVYSYSPDGHRQGSKFRNVE